MPTPNTILVVEDDNNLREVVTLTLLELGFEVLVARNGLEALECMQKSEEVALIFADFKLDAAMCGAELARRAREFRPSINILLTSGYTSEQIRRHPDAAALPILHKPYRMQELEAWLLKLLGKPTGHQDRSLLAASLDAP